jgi:diacylglycerol kinase (ATP)
MKKRMRVTLIYNPSAGEDEQLSADALVDLISRAGHSVVRHSSRDDEWDNALAEPADIVAVAGGDGTVGKVAKSLIGKPTAIAVLPMGTANNVAMTLGIMNRPLEELIAEWTSARRVKFDVGKTKGPWGSAYFIEGFGVGLFTETMSRLHSRENVDLDHLDDTQIKITSVLQILKQRLRNYRAKKLKVTVDGQDVSGEYILLEALNIRDIGPNLHLAPDADPSDGFLDIACVSAGEQNHLSRYLSEAMQNKFSLPGWTDRRGQHMQIEWDGYTVHIDDEAWPGKDSTLPSSPRTIDVTAQCQTVEFLTPG